MFRFSFRREHTIHFKDLIQENTRRPNENTTGGITWANDNKTIFMLKDEQTLRSHKIFKHVLGTDSSDDELCLEVR